MPLHLTKVAYGAQSLDELHGWFRQRGAEARLTTRDLPKRHEELVPGGSLYRIHQPQLGARTEILRFEEAEGGKTNIVISTRLIDVHPAPKRAHQGWRYLKDEDAPPDLGSGVMEGDVLPGHLVKELAKLGLV